MKSKLWKFLKYGLFLSLGLTIVYAFIETQSYKKENENNIKNDIQSKKDSIRIEDKLTPPIEEEKPQKTDPLKHKQEMRERWVKQKEEEESKANRQKATK